MHFWIDKRSQAYGFGRARVAASLSGAGGNGLGFAHPPRRMGGKTSLMPTIHRLPSSSSSQQQQHSHSHGHHQQQSTTIDCHRSHSIANNNNNNNTAHNSYHSHNTNNNHHSNSNNNSSSNNIIAASNNNNFSNNGGGGGGTMVHYSSSSNFRQSRGCRSGSVNSATLNNNNHHDPSTALTSSSRSYHHHPQFGNMSIRHYQTQHSSLTSGEHSGSYAARVHHHQHHHHSQSHRSHSSAPSASSVTSVSLPPIYVSPSHAQSLEQGPMGMGPIPTVRLHHSNTTGTVTTTTTASNPILDSAASTDGQVLPSHLKFGMWATLILASVFVAGVKLYADHQGSGLEVLIFAAFSATFFLAACTVSLCRLPSSLAASPSLSIDDSSRGLLTQHNNQLNLHYQPAQQPPPPLSLSQPSQENLELTPTGAPPPYHIAILLPENGKELQYKDESPPPSYDKIVI